MTESPSASTAERFTVRPRPPFRALMVTAGVEVVGGALLLFGVITGRSALTWLALGLLIMGVITAGLITWAWRRVNVTLILTTQSITAVRGRSRRELAWSAIDGVTLQGAQLTLASRSERDLTVLNPRGPSEARFAALVLAVRDHLDADCGYRPFSFGTNAEQL